ncbi:MAG: SHOCT domain-containing protein [Anaerolineales bacterium]|nr:SHOCT domain-containing protein [Anaerolineales bacterium]
MKNLERKLLDLLAHYKEFLKEQVSNTEGTKQDWYGQIQEHYEKDLLPLLEDNSEEFVEYWPAGFIWDEVSQLRTYSRRSSRVLNGSHGSGYLAASSDALYISVFNDLSKNYSPIPTGLAYQVLSGMSGERDARKPYKGDKTWRIGYSEITGIRAVDDRVLLIATAVGDWKITQHFSGDLEIIQTAISMGRNGRFGKTASTTNDEIIVMLEKLAKLRDSGAISSDDFEDQKKKLLTKIK